MLCSTWEQGFERRNNLISHTYFEMRNVTPKLKNCLLSVYNSTSPEKNEPIVYFALT